MPAMGHIPRSTERISCWQWDFRKKLAKFVAKSRSTPITAF